MVERVHREAAMSPWVVAWLKSLGYSAYAERGVWRPIDHIGIRWSDRSIICVEMKCSLSDKVIYQAFLNQLITPLSYVAVPRMPRAKSIERIKGACLGLLVDGVVVVEPVARKDYDKFGQHYRDQIYRQCEGAVEDEVGGLPTLLGDGPAIRVAAAVRAYREANPQAKWRDIWANVPNHYQHYRSMQGAVRRIEGTVKRVRTVDAKRGKTENQ